VATRKDHWQPHGAAATVIHALRGTTGHEECAWDSRLQPVNGDHLKVRVPVPVHQRHFQPSCHAPWRTPTDENVWFGDSRLQPVNGDRLKARVPGKAVHFHIRDWPQKRPGNLLVSASLCGIIGS